MEKISVIGAGIAGLTLAQMISKSANVTIFEKSRGVGGRMATRRVQNYHFDHGAQFFTAKTTEFKNFLIPMIKNKVVMNWGARFVEMQRNKILSSRIWNDDYPHFVGVPGMTSISKHLSQDLNVYLNTKVAKIERSNNMWKLFDAENKLLGDFNWVIFAIPAPQIKCIQGVKEFKHFDSCNNKKMTGCYSLMLGFDKQIKLSWDAALVHDARISWISVNSSKPQRGEKFCILVNSTNDWAEKHLSDSKDSVIQALIKETSVIIGNDIKNANCIDLHRWKYANIARQTPIEPLIDHSNKMAACGDWCSYGRIESAFNNGHNLALKLLDILI